MAPSRQQRRILRGLGKRIPETRERGSLDCGQTMPQYPNTPFNYARPTVHTGGSVLALLDGHVERVAFAQLWNVDPSGKVTHSFWRIED
ncbi:MAG TPA: hypothetical protein P5555_14320 [Candidatus Paceibacterota bacterium]|nr:hypothetical protein [Verrucomicrobiota bacterium]HRZ46361.1 hypothetical protein [Candidatus Paceibacterota bacterium]